MNNPLKNLKTFKDLNEGDWWDNDPNAPWNQDDQEPEEYMEIEYKPEQQLFDLVAHAGWLGILKGKSPVEGYWVINLDEVPDEYQLVFDWGEDAEKEYNVTEDSIVNYATDLYKDSAQVNTPEGWEDGESLLAPLADQAIVDDVIDSIESSLAPGYQERYRAGYSAEQKSEMRRALHVLSKLKFD
jgi:hypothetical protein